MQKTCIISKVCTVYVIMLEKEIAADKSSRIAVSSSF